MPFEYLVLEVSENSSGLNILFSDGTEKPAGNLESILNSYGAEGWELLETSLLAWQQDDTTNILTIDTCRLIFKRPLKE